MPRGLPEGFQWLEADPDTRFSGYPAQDTPVLPTYRDYPQNTGVPYGEEIPKPLGYATHRPLVFLGRTMEDVPGLVKPGTIDLTDPFKPTQDAFHIEDGGMHVVLPNWGSREAMIAQYKETGQSFGKFKDAESADAYTRHLNDWSQYEAPKPYGLGVISENALGQPTGPKKGRKDAATVNAEIERQMQASGGNSELVSIPPEPQESIRDKDRQVGMIEPPNIDLDNLTPYALPTGEMDTLRPILYNDPKSKQTVLIPSLIDGTVFSRSAAIRDYEKTGKHLGKFKDELYASEYRSQLQDRQNQFYGIAASMTQYANEASGVPEPPTPPGSLAPRLTPEEKAARAREQNPYPLPTLLSPETGKMEEVDPRWANARGIPIGMPRPGGGGPRPTGGPEYPDKEGRAAMLGDPGLLASAERRNRNEMSTDNPGVPEGFQWLGADDPAAQAAQESAQKAEQQAGGGYEQGIASTFGYNDPEDNGVGAWGDITDDPNAYGVALPVRQLREMFGDPDKAYGAIVELTNPHTGQTVRAPILDKGPAEWVLNRQGPTIDVTEGVRRQMGLGGKSDMQWRVLGHGFPSDNPMLGPGGPLEGFQWEGNGDIAKPVGQGTTGLPEGFQWLPAEGQPTTDTGAIVPGGKGTPIAPPSEEESNRLIEAEQTKPTPSEDRIDVPELDQKQPQAPVQQPVRDPAERAANRQRLIDAIQTSEDAGYPVPHTIGTPEEPEGDRGPTRDMEHLVEALKLAEEDAKASNEKWQAAQIGKERAYWEDHIKTFGMSAEQAARAEAKPATEGKPVYTQGPKPKGMLEEGNLDINNRPVLHNPDGTISTESSISIDDNGKEVLIPTVIDGKRVTNTEAVGHYKTTGENLGKFDSPEAADAYAKTLHQRGYTEEQKKAEDARNQAQQQKAGLPRFSLSQEMAFAKAGERHSRGLGAKESELPTLTPQEADKLGLKSWMDPSGVEVRRATLPDVMRARRAHEIGDQPYEMGFNTYAGRLKGMPSDDLEVMKQIRNSVWFKARVDKGEKEEDILKNIRNDVGTQAALRFAAGAESGAKGIPKGAFDMLSSATHDYRNQYLKATPEEAAKAVPVLEMSLEQEKKRAQELLTKTKGAEDLIPGTGYPKPPELGGVTRGPLPAYGPGQRGYVDSKGEYAQSLLEIANISRQLAYAKDRAAGKPAQESFLGQVSRKAGEDAAYFYRKEQEGKKKYQAFINDAMEKDRGKVVKFVMDFASSTGNTAPSLALMLANPYVGFAAFATQQYSDSLDEYLTQNPRKPGEDPTEYFNKSRAYARDMMVEQVPFEAVGDFAALTVMKRAFREIPAAVLARANGKEIGKFVAKAAVEGGISEGVTQPPQTFIQETRAEAAGVQAPTTREEKLAKAGYETGLAVTQGMAMGGAGAGLGAASLRSQTASRDARVIQHIKGAIAQRKAEEQTPYAQGGAIPSVAGPSTKSTGLFPSQATPSTAAPAPPPNLTQRFNDLTPDARARVQAVPLMHWDQAIRNEEANIAAAAAAGTGPITPPAPGPEVEGPTTDAELEKMKQDYLGGPAAASALARSLGARTQAEEKQVLADNFRHLTKFHKSVLALGADFRTDHGARTSGVVNWDDSSGKLKATLTINPTLLLSRTVKSPLAPGGEARIVGGEELLHLADITSLGKLWENDKTANHNPGGFDQYLSQVSENELKDVENAVMSAPQAERDSLLQGLSDVHHVYLGDYTAPSGLPANRDIFKAIRSDPRTGKNNTFKFIFETARMVAQQKAQGLISEHTARNIWTNLNDYFNKVLARITGQLPRFEQGAYGPMMQAHVQRMQDQMAEWEAELKLQGKPALMPQLTPEEKARATAEKPHAAYERPPPAPKSLKQAMQETFGFVKQATLGGKRKETPEQVRERLRQQGMIGAREGLGAREEERPKASLTERMRRLGLLPGQGVHFQPAVKIGDKVIAGASHFDAVRNAKQIGYSNEEIMRGTVGNLDENHHFKSFDTREQALHKETSARAMGLATREGAATLNIGMATDDGKGLSLEEVLKALEETGAGVRGYRVAPSATEPTVVAYLNRTLDPEEAFKLSKDLRQQAIAEKFEGGADLYGPAAAAWRPFNEDFFLASRQPAPELARSLDELEYLAKHYEEHKLWYEKFSAFLDSVLGANHEYKPLIMDFIAATSPGTNIGPNVRQAVDKLRQFMEEGTVTYHGLGHWPKSKLPNLGRAIRAEELQGPKVSPFSEALKGDPRSAAIDRHVAMVLFNTRKPTDAQIKVGQQAARDIAERLGWTPREVQAAWWAAGKEMFGAQPGERAKIVETYEQYLKEYQDELNAILTKDREGEARGLRAARAISERAGQRAGAARSVGGQSLGTRAGPEDLDKEQARHGYQPRTPEERGLPGETALSKLNKTEGGYWLSPSGRLYNVRAYGPTHYDYARDMMGVTMPEAFNKGWVRLLTFSGDKTVYWDGNRANNLQIRTIRDVADTLGYSTYRDQDYTQRAALGLGTREEEGLGARAAEKPVLHPLIGSPLKLYKTTLAGRKFAPHFIRPAWDIVGMHRFYSSVARVFDKLPGVEYMGPAIRKNDDLLSKYRGEFHNRAATEFKKAPRHIMEEYKNYWINNQFRGRNFADNQPISPRALRLVNLSKDLFREMGDRARGKIKIYDPATKTWRPFQPMADPFRDYHPHILRADISEVLHNAASDPAVWNELQDEMIKEGIIPGIDPDAEMTKHVSNLLDKFTVNGFFGSIERSRTADYPTKAYDFSANALFNYIDAWAERMAQTEAFGQGVGGQKTLWDMAVKDAGNKATIDFIKHVRNHIYGEDTHSLLGRAVNVITRFAVGEQLGSFFYTGRNLVFGTGFNWQHYGFLPFARSVLNLRGTFRDIREAKEKGIIMEDIMNVMRDGGRAGWTGKWASTLLRIHGNNQVEAWLRGTAMRMARIVLRANIRRYGRNPRGMRIRQFIGYLDNLGFKGFEPHNLLMENGTGPLTDRYLRASVKAAQGGYTIAQTTLFADSPEGRFWLMYSKFGLERIQDFALNVSKPFLRQIRAPGTKQVVILPDKNGNPENVRVPAGFVPMIRYLMVLGGAGAGWEWVAENIFGIHARTASWAEIFAAMDENQGAAFADLAEKMFSYLIQAGAFGLVGNYAQMGMDITQRVNFKSPLDPPALQPLKDLGQEFLNFLDQGPPTSIEDAQARVDKFIEKSLSGYKRIKQLGAHVLTEYEQRSPGGPLPDDVFGIHRSLELAARRADFNLVRAATHRYDREIGTRANVRSPGVFGKNMESDFRDRLFEDLVLGDTQSASKRIEEHFKDWEPARQAQELKNLQQSVAARQPVKAGAGGGDREAGREDFLRWAERRLPEDQVAILERVDKTYRETAQAIQFNGKYLMKADQLVPEMRIEKAMKRIKMMQQ